MIGLIKNLKNKYNLQIQYLHCNAAGENAAFRKDCKEEVLEVDFEYIAPGMPQQSDHANQKFTILFNRVCTMLNGSIFNAYL